MTTKTSKNQPSATRATVASLTKEFSQQAAKPPINSSPTVCAKGPLLQKASAMVSAFIPTAYGFTSGTLLSKPGTRSRPKMWMTKTQFFYAIVVCSENEEAPKTAWRIESLIFNAAREKIAGVAVVKYGTDDAPPEAAAAREQLRNTFWDLFGLTAPRQLNDVTPYLEAMMNLKAFNGVYNGVDWQQILEINTSTLGWENRVVTHCGSSLAQKKSLRP